MRSACLITRDRANVSDLALHLLVNELHHVEPHVVTHLHCLLFFERDRLAYIVVQIVTLAWVTVAACT